MKARLLNVLAIVSLGLCLLSVYYWLRSYLPEHSRICTHNGQLVIIFTGTQFNSDWREDKMGVPTALWIIRTPANARINWRVLGLEFVLGGSGRSSTYALIGIHFAYVVPALAIFPIWWFRARVVNDAEPCKATARPAAMTCAPRRIGVRNAVTLRRLNWKRQERTKAQEHPGLIT